MCCGGDGNKKARKMRALMTGADGTEGAKTHEILLLKGRLPPDSGVKRGNFDRVFNINFNITRLHRSLTV